MAVSNLETQAFKNTYFKIMFDKVISGQIKIKIFKKYKLDDVVKAHMDLEDRKILGPAIITP